ncbi:putative Oxidoreductase-like protein [Seiridium unicorne]|uniref:Oxidoreductase-like protein n=1 Tax=Seiridium unicorne TaxID=138068 RepID=A0ABR2VCC4_9PEZI
MSDTLLKNIIKSTGYPPVPPNIGTNYTNTTHNDTYEFVNPVKVDCSGKAVLITGGSKGIGKGVAISYAKAGASHIAITSRSDASAIVDEIKTAAVSAGRSAPTVLAFQVDVLDKASVKAAAGTVEREWGRLDILISNAGFLAPYEKILDSDDDDWWQSFETNIRGMYFVAKALLPLMLKGGDKTIISISSTGVMHYHTGGSSYQISKLALLRLTEYLMAEYADQGLLTYSIHPGGVATDLASNLPQQTQAWLKCTPALGGDTIAFLTTQRQDWLAGRYLSAMWDMQELFSKREEIIEKDLLRMKMAF